MYFHAPSRADFALAVAYFLAAALTIASTRFDGGVAFLWVASALLIPALARRPRREWGTPLLLCGLSSAAVTGSLGMGWSSALPLAVVNMAEAYMGAAWLARTRAARSPLSSLGWFGNFIFSVGILAPAFAAVLAAAFLLDSGLPFLPTLVRYFTGHALGNITFIPLVGLILSGHFTARLKGLSRNRRIETVALLALVAATSAASFSAEHLPLLFLPCGPIILATFRGREIGAAMSIALLAIVGGALTVAGYGAINLIDAPLGWRLQFLQFYLAAAVLTVLPIAADLRNRARLHRELRHKEARYRLLADHSTDIILHMAPDGQILYASPSIWQLSGHDPELVKGRNIMTLVPAEAWDQVRDGHLATVAANGKTHSYRHLATTSSGETRWFESHCRVMLDERGEVEGILSIVRDIARQVADEDRLAIAAMTDPLTGLANRRAFWVAAEGALAASEESSAGCIAILDLDHFKRVNDVHGHDGGDAVLCQFAAQAAEAVRAGDTVARLGGEEFALLLPGASVEAAIAICERLRTEIAAMGVPARTGMIRVTISGGVAELRPDGLEAAMKRADLALYQAKDGGRDQLALAA